MNTEEFKINPEYKYYPNRLFRRRPFYYIRPIVINESPEYKKCVNSIVRCPKEWEKVSGKIGNVAELCKLERVQNIVKKFPQECGKEEYIRDPVGQQSTNIPAECTIGIF